MNFLSRILHREVIGIAAGQVSSRKGRHTRGLLSDIEDVCREFGIADGEIYFAGNGKLRFSDKIPAAAHQPLRNVIVNHSAV